LDILREKAKKNYFIRLLRGKTQVFQAPNGYSTADQAFIAVLCDNIWTFLGKKPKKIILQGFGGEKDKYFKPRPDIQQLTRLLLQIYVTIFGHFKGKSQKKIFYKALERKTQVFQAPTGYSTADKAFIADLCDNIWTI
jgi:hypothetical protein